MSCTYPAQALVCVEQASCMVNKSPHQCAAQRVNYMNNLTKTDSLRPRQYITHVAQAFFSFMWLCITKRTTPNTQEDRACASFRPLSHGRLDRCTPKADLVTARTPTRGVQKTRCSRSYPTLKFKCVELQAAVLLQVACSSWGLKIGASQVAAV